MRYSCITILPGAGSDLRGDHGGEHPAQEGSSKEGHRDEEAEVPDQDGQGEGGNQTPPGAGY